MNIILYIAGALLIGLNLRASFLLFHSCMATPAQKTVQMVVVWFVPVLGAYFVMQLHSKNDPKKVLESGLHRPTDDYASSMFSQFNDTNSHGH